MPSGYTSTIADGASFKQFLLRCAHAFAPLHRSADGPMDAPLPPRLQPDSYYLERHNDYKEEIERLNAMSDYACECEAVGEFKRAQEASEADVARKTQWRIKYEAMLEKVQQWAPPTENHAGLKKFMIQQLEEAIRWDCEIYTDDRVYLTVGKEWRAGKLTELQEQADRKFKDYLEEVAATAGRNAWIDALRDQV